MFKIKNKDIYVYAKMRLDLSGLKKEVIDVLSKKVEKIKHLINFKEYTTSDKEIFIRIYNRAFLTSPDPFHSITLDDLEDLNLKVFFIKMFGREYGLICISIEQNEKNEKIGVIITLAVMPEKQRRGLGSALALKAYEFLKQNNINIVECEVGEKNIPSYTFVKFIGFRKYGEEILELDP